MEFICPKCGSHVGPDVPVLPHGWEEHKVEDDEEDNRTYYYHQISDTVRWKPPPDTPQLSLIVFKKTNSVFSCCVCHRHAWLAYGDDGEVEGEAKASEEF